MPVTRTALIFVAVALASTGCTKDNPKYCASHDECPGLCDMVTHSCELGTVDGGVSDAQAPDAATCGTDSECTTVTSPICDDTSRECRGCDGTGMTTECSDVSVATPYCASDGRCAPCAGTEGCTSDVFAPVCDAAAFACRACEGSGEVVECMDIDTSRPRCAPDGRCVQCESHGDCTSGVCNAGTGTCVAQPSILYVDRTLGANTIGCGSLGSACLTINYGLSQRLSQTHVLIRPGNYFENIDLDLITLTIVGPGAEIVSSAGSTPVINVHGGADITVDGLTVRGATGQSGIDCGDSTSKLTLTGGARITSNGGHGVDVSDCALRILDAAVQGNSSVGVLVSGGSLELRRSSVSGNLGGGVWVDKAVFTIVNNFIVDNGKSGGSGSDLAGVLINNIGFTATETMMFNTIADNRARDGSSSFGVSCNVSGASTTRISSNIVYNGGSATVVTGNCVWSHSLYRGASGGDNIEGDPRFVSGSNFHLEDDSPCLDKGESVPEVRIDFDGDERPQDTGHDMGADERPVAM